MPPSIATPLSSLTARDLYGVRALTPTGVVPFGYTGHAEDPTGLTWGRARCYAPRTGGWTGEDPVYTEPRYGYVGGRPNALTDPDGRMAAFDNAFFKKFLTCASARGLVILGPVIAATFAASSFLFLSVSDPGIGHNVAAGAGAAGAVGMGAATKMADVAMGVLCG